jgi:hypothetical protein
MNYDGFLISRSALAGLSDERMCWAVVERFWPDADCDEQARLAAGTTGQRAIYTGIVFAREVDNGGLEQFFWNSSGDLYDEVLEGLMRIGAADRAVALRRAGHFFGRAVRRREVRQQKLDSATREEKQAFFGPLEEQLYGEKGSVERELVPIFCRYIDEQPAEFFEDVGG